MRKLRLLVSVAIVSLIAFSGAIIVMSPQHVAAVDVIGPGIDCSATGEDNTNPKVCQIDENQTATENVLVGEDGIITRATQALVWVSGALALILIIIAGIMFIFSQGNPESTSRARSTVIYAVIGLVIAVVGQLIVLLVLDRL